MLRSRLVAAACAVCAVCAFAPAATAQPKKLHRIAVGAVGELGNTSNNRALVASIEADIVALALGEVISTANIEKSIKRAKKPQLLACEGDTRCLAEMGRIAGAEWVIGVEIGGLGDVRVLHLRLIVAGTGKTLRSTTSALEGDVAEKGKLVQLLAPRRFRGALEVNANVEGADIIVDAKVVGKTTADKASKPIVLPVGTRALRVTHPNYRDHVRFIELSYGTTTKVDIDMVALDVSRQSLERNGGPLGSSPGDKSASRPWYGRWYVIAGISAAVLVGSVAIWSATGGIDADREVELPQR